LASTLAGQQLIEEISVRGFPLRRLFQAGGQFLFDLVEPQLMAVFVQPVELRSAHRASPPSLWLTIS